MTPRVHEPTLAVPSSTNKALENRRNLAREQSALAGRESALFACVRRGLVVVLCLAISATLLALLARTPAARGIASIGLWVIAVGGWIVLSLIASNAIEASLMASKSTMSPLMQVLLTIVASVVCLFIATGVVAGAALVLTP